MPKAMSKNAVIRKFKRDEITRKILFTIAGIAGTTALLAMAAVAPNSLRMLKLFEDNEDKRKTQRVLKRISHQKLVEISEEKDGEVIRITEKGRQKILKYAFDEMQIKRPRRWDGIWRIVAFDVPNKNKKARDALRMKLRELDFTKLQESVFVHPYDCKNEIDFIGEIFNIRENINYIEAVSIEDESYLKKHFKL